MPQLINRHQVDQVRLGDIAHLVGKLGAISEPLLHPVREFDMRVIYLPGFCRWPRCRLRYSLDPDGCLFHFIANDYSKKVRGKSDPHRESLAPLPCLRNSNTVPTICKTASVANRQNRRGYIDQEPTLAQVLFVSP